MRARSWSITFPARGWGLLPDKPYAVPASCICVAEIRIAKTKKNGYNL